MRVKLDIDGQRVIYHFELEPRDKPIRRAHNGRVVARFVPEDVIYELPPGWRADKMHPDLLAAVAVAIAGEATRRILRLSWPVSRPFADRIAEVYPFCVRPTRASLSPRQARPGARPALAYSAGVDSTAALRLMPPETVPVFLERIGSSPRLPYSLYCKDAAVRASGILRQAGREAWTVGTNVEFTREPIGYANDAVTATPILLLADWLNLDATGYGLILESSYLDKGYRFREYTQSRHWRVYATLFAAVGLPWHLVTAGLSEVVTTRLVLESPYHHVAQSCTRGAFASPCENCWKCFRKRLLEAALAGVDLPPAVLDRYFDIHEASSKLDEAPIKHEDVILFILQRYRGAHRRMRGLYDELLADEVDVEWLQRWFPPSRELLAAAYAADTERRITQSVPPMTDQDIAAVRAWDRVAAALECGRLAATEPGAEAKR